MHTTRNTMLDPRTIDPPRVECREERDPAHVAALASLMREKGFLGAILVRATATGHEVVWGETRRQAAIVAELRQIPVQVVEGELSESDEIQLQLDENEHRQDYRPIESFRALLRLKELNGWSNAELARQRRRPASEITKAFSILAGYPEDLWPLVGEGDGKVPVTTAYQLSRLEDVSAIRELTDKVVKGLLTRDAAEEVVGKLLGKTGRRSKPVRLRTPKGVVVVIPGDLSPDAVLGELSSPSDALRKVMKHGLPLSSLPNLLKSEAGPAGLPTLRSA